LGEGRRGEAARDWGRREAARDWGRREAREGVIGKRKCEQQRIMGEREREGKEWVEWGGREGDRQTGRLINNQWADSR
jgi:hypothetical protein